MLPIKCSDELAAVNVFKCKNGNLDLGQQRLASHSRQRGLAHRMHGAAHDRVYVYLYLAASPANQQSSFTVTTSSRHVNVKSLRLQSSRRLPDSSVDSGERVVAPHSVIREDEVQVDGQSGHVANE